MVIKNLIPPDPQHVILKKIYPWDKYNIELIMSWLYDQAKQTGFDGTLNDFKLHYGDYIASLDISQVYELIDHYNEDYHITPLPGVEQILNTKNKLLTEDIIVDPIPDVVIPANYEGSYLVTPLADVSQILRTANRTLGDDVIVEQIPYYETTNNAGGYTAIIG